MATKLAAEQREQLRESLTPRLTKYIPHVPTVKQQVGLLLPQDEVLYGGAAGGGKSDWLLMGALQYVDVPGYSALLMRRTYKELELEGGLLERAWDWLSETDAKPHDGGMRWTFGGEGLEGAVLQFGYLEHPQHHLRYQGSSWQFIGLDELTHFRELQYRYMFSRLRRPDTDETTTDRERGIIEALASVPLRMRAASNPGGPGHEWVRDRFGIWRPDGEEDQPRLCHRPDWVRKHSRVFLPATIDDNPHLDSEAYDRALEQLDSKTRRQLRDGDWDVKDPGEMFRSEWFEILDAAPECEEVVRYWDLAATEPSSRNPNPDWTVGLKLGRTAEGHWVILHVVRGRWRSERVEQRVRITAEIDGPEVPIWIEQEPGASGKHEQLVWQRDILPGFEVHAHPPSDSKGIRARVPASKAEAGLVKLVRARWNAPLLDELEDFPPDDEGHDDQVDAFSGAFAQLTAEPGPPSTGPSVRT